jgi:hypothetical protein
VYRGVGELRVEENIKTLIRVGGRMEPAGENIKNIYRGG